MALKQKSPGRWWSRLHFLIRFTGLFGVLAAGLGCALAYLRDTLPRIADVGAVTSAEKAQAWWNYVLDHVTGKAGSLSEELAVGLLVGGAAFVVLALLVELIVTLFFVAGRRSAFGVNVAVQAALAGVLLIGVNLYSFGHY